MSIDWWTLGIQAVNVLVLVWLLARFFWKPVAAMIEQRRAAAQQMLADAQSQQQQAAAALADIERTRAGFAQEREAILAAARVDAEQARSTQLQQAALEAAAIAERAHIGLAKDRAAAEAAWQQRASQLAVDIASRLCEPLAGPATQTIFLERLLQQIAGLPEPERRAIAAPGAALEAVSAAPLAEDAQTRLRQGLADALGGAAEITFVTDPALIAGLELRGTHLIVGNSWRADLQRIRTELAHDDA